MCENQRNSNRRLVSFFSRPFCFELSIVHQSINQSIKSRQSFFILLIVSFLSVPRSLSLSYFPLFSFCPCCLDCYSECRLIRLLVCLNVASGKKNSNIFQRWTKNSAHVSSCTRLHSTGWSKSRVLQGVPGINYHGTPCNVKTFPRSNIWRKFFGRPVTFLWIIEIVGVWNILPFRFSSCPYVSKTSAQRLSSRKFFIPC